MSQTRVLYKISMKIAAGVSTKKINKQVNSMKKKNKF